MKRREFIINSAILAGGAALLGGCNKKELIKDKMVEYCMQKGANYFDTAYMYVNSQSEIAMGKVLKKYKREDFILI